MTFTESGLGGGLPYNTDLNIQVLAAYLPMITRGHLYE